MIKMIADRLLRGMNCWVICYSKTQVELIHKHIKEEIKATPLRSIKAPIAMTEWLGHGWLRLSVMRQNTPLDFHSHNLADISLFLNDCEWKAKETKFFFTQYPESLFRELTLTRCTGDEAQPEVI
jgi:hypothetical protein